MSRSGRKKRKPQPQAKPRVGPRAKEGAAAKGSAKPDAPVLLQATPGKRIYAAIFGTAFFVLLVANATVMSKAHLSILPLLLVVGCCLGCVRMYRLAVIADEKGLVVRNFMRTHRLRWADVKEIKMDPPVTKIDGWEIAVVRGPVGRSLRPTKIIRLDAAKRAVHRSLEKEKAELEPAHRQLNAWLRYARAAGEAGPEARSEAGGAPD